MDKVQHFEIPADDIKRAKKFYEMTFGWKVTEMPEFDYTMVNTANTDEKGMLHEMGVINGGMMKRSPKVRSPVITISVDDIDKSLKEVEKNGGQVVIGKMEIPKVGFSAYIKDSEGNTIGLFHPLRNMYLQ